VRYAVDYLDDLIPAPGCSQAWRVGHREPDLIATLVRDPNTFPLVILKGSEPVGFARVLRIAATAAPPGIDYRMAEFFVARGAAPAGYRPDRRATDPEPLRGALGVTEYLRNAARELLARVVASYTRGSYQERIVNGEVHQVFDSGRARPA